MRHRTACPAGPPAGILLRRIERRGKRLGLLEIARGHASDLPAPRLQIGAGQVQLGALAPEHEDRIAA